MKWYHHREHTDNSSFRHKYLATCNDDRSPRHIYHKICNVCWNYDCKGNNGDDSSNSWILFKIDTYILILKVTSLTHVLRKDSNKHFQELFSLDQCNMLDHQ